MVLSCCASFCPGSLGEVRCGDICNACVLLVKRWKKLPAGSKKNWNHVRTRSAPTHLFFFLLILQSCPFTGSSCEGLSPVSFQVVDAKAGSSMKATLRTKKIKRKMRQSQMSRVQNQLKKNSKLTVLIAVFILNLNKTASYLCDCTQYNVETPTEASVNIFARFSWWFVNSLSLCSRLRCTQHHLLCLPRSVTQLQQPVRRGLRHRAFTRPCPLTGLLLPGPHLLEKVIPLHFV